MRTTEYLDAVKAKLGLPSDYALAGRLDTSTAAIGQYRNGKRVMDDYTAARVAELLEMDPMTVIAQANAEREKDEKKRAFWSKFAAAASLVMVVGFFSTAVPKHAYASTTCSGQTAEIPIMAVLKRRWHAARRWLLGTALFEELTRLLGGSRILRTS